MVFGLILLATLSAGGAGTVAREVTLTRHVPDVVARGVAPRIGAPLPQQTMEISISLPSRNEAELQALLATIYDPAITETDARFGVNAGLSPFDPQLTTDLFWERNHEPRDVASNINLPIELNQDVAQFDTAFTKTTADGTVLTLYDPSNTSVIMHRLAN